MHRRSHACWWWLALAALVAVPMGLLVSAPPPAQVAGNTWAVRTPMPTARRFLGVAAAANGKLYAIGGYSGNSLARAEEYDPATNSWAPRAPMPTARDSLGVGAAANGKL